MGMKKKCLDDHSKLFIISHDRLHFFLALICENAKADWIYRRCNDHIKWCGEKEAEAQGWIDTFGHNNTRNKNWREAARAGIPIFQQIKQSVRDPKMTVEVFQEMVWHIRNERDNAGKKNWGLGGHDSGMSNPVQHGHRDAAQEILNALQ